MPLNLENNQQTTAVNPSTSFTSRRKFVISSTNLFLLLAFFVCTLLAASFIIYNFATCDQLSAGEEVVCTVIRRKLDNKTNDFNDDETPKYERNIRLPNSIKPLVYNISIIPFLTQNNFRFEGQTQIKMKVLADCYNITMHAVELNISKSSVNIREISNTSTSDIRIRKQYLVDAKQFFIIKLFDRLKKDHEYVINIEFEGLIQDNLQGFYRSSYQMGNETRYLASTQMQATDARRAFPCFDEPALKAKFQLNIARPKNMSTISNMPILTTKQHESITDYVWDNFAESLPMSTYLVAYTISDFKHLTAEGNFSAWARAEAITSAQYALSVGTKLLKFLEQYFGIKFPLPKIDMIALPDFQAGAMENWGLITYRETTMLFDDHVSATTNKQRIVSVVGHELAHQWFGNLVTPSWWSDIWLNEGFASFMEYLTADAIEPKWKSMEQFVVNELHNVFQLDALSTSHKISIEVFNPDEIIEIFDRISYGKGSAIIRMMSHFLTTRIFRNGLTNYLKTMAYKNAEQDDLWRFLTNEAVANGILDKSISVKDIMDTWTLQTGYPVVTVHRNPHTFVIELHQQRFVFSNETNFKNVTDNLNWWIPITYTTSEMLDFQNTRPVTWIPRTKTYKFENRDLSISKWFIFNIQQTGYYRTNYDEENWNAIIKHLTFNAKNKDNIAASNRAQLIDDSMNLARGSYINYNIPLNLSRYLVYEDDYVPWKAAIASFQFIDTMFVNQGDYDLLKNYLLKLIENSYNDIGFEDKPGTSEDMLLLLKRVEILNMACHLGHSDCISESSRRFQNWVQEPNPDVNNPISPNLRGIVYCSAIQYGTEAEWDFAFDRYLKSDVSTEKELLLSALGCSAKPWILFRYLRRSINGDSIRKQDVYRVFAAVANNDVGQQVVFDFIRANWWEIKTYLGSSLTNLNTIIKFSTKRMNTKFFLKEFEDFVKNDLKENGRTIRQCLEQVRVNVKWMNDNYNTIVQWLRHVV